MTAIDLGNISRITDRPGAIPAPWPAATHPDPPQVPSGPWSPRTDSDFPYATDPALDGHTPPTLDDLGLTADPVAQVVRMREQIDALIAGMTDQQRADLAQYPRHLKAVA